ncbi:MAG: STAS domain-containing protein [Solirubrobacteraceae bacterium]
MTALNRQPVQPFSISVAPGDHEAVVTSTGELDLVSAPLLQREVQLLLRAGFDHVVLDLRHIEFMDSTGLQVLLSLRNSAQRDGQRLILVAGRNEVQRIFDITATRGLFDWRA